jgi:hypothetical protein
MGHGGCLHSINALFVFFFQSLWSSFQLCLASEMMVDACPCRTEGFEFWVCDILKSPLELLRILASGLSWRMMIEKIPSEFLCRADYPLGHGMANHDLSTLPRAKQSSAVHI